MSNAHTNDDLEAGYKAYKNDHNKKDFEFLHPQSHMNILKHIQAKDIQHVKISKYTKNRKRLKYHNILFITIEY